MQPDDPALRSEFKSLLDVKNEKERQWYSKMDGFYRNAKLNNLEASETAEAELREKIKRQTFE